MLTRSWSLSRAEARRRDLFDPFSARTANLEFVDIDAASGLGLGELAKDD